jgi:hypothetical protein
VVKYKYGYVKSVKINDDAVCVNLLLYVKRLYRVKEAVEGKGGCYMESMLSFV